MSKELVKKLLETKTEEEFFECLDENADFDYVVDKEKWDKKVIEHLKKISGMTDEEIDEIFIDVFY